MINKILQKNIQLSYKLIGALNHRLDKEDGFYRAQLKLFLETFTETLTGKRILDVGSGSWLWTKETFSHIGHVTTFDRAESTGVDVVGDIYEIGKLLSTSAPFDAVIATDVFEHLAKPHDALRELYSILASGGIFIASTPFKKNLHGEDYGDYWRITRQGWRHMLESCHFFDINITWLGEELFPTAYFVCATKL